MKSCRDRKYDKCNQPVEDECQCCPYCGGELESDYEHSNVCMGNANAISGGVHSADDHSKKDSDNVVNSHNVTNTNSNNTSNNTTIYEAQKSDSEKLKENEITYRLECKALFRDGFISNEGERKLRELQVHLNLADELVLPIKEEIRLLSKKRKTQLSSTGLSDIRQTKSIIEQNTAPALQRQLVKLESWMQEYDDNTLKLMYYQMSSMLEPVRYTNRYEDSVKDEYWEAYWAYIAYLLQNRGKQANEALASLGRWHAYYPEQNDTILLLVGRLMQDEPIEDIQQARKQLTAHFTADLQLLLDAIDELLQMDWVKETILIRPAHSFYITTLFGQFVETQKAAGVEHLNVKREQERIKHEEEERIRQTELELQNQIRNQKASVLQKFQEIGRLEIACQEVGADFHTVNIWLEEDSNFASSYNELVHCMEVRKSEEVEKKRKEQEIEAETKRKKSQFKTLFEQNECDLLKTCSEVGISSADYQEWRRQDSAFNDGMNYIIRKNKEYVEQQNRERRNEKIKKIRPFLLVAIVLGAIVSGINLYIDNKESKAQIEVTQSYENMIDEFDTNFANINDSDKGYDYIGKCCSIVNEMQEIEQNEHFNSSEQSLHLKLKLNQKIQGYIEHYRPLTTDGDKEVESVARRRMNRLNELKKSLAQ